MDSIAFIESNTTGTGEIFLQKAQEKNLKIIFLTANPDKYKFLKKLLIYPTIVDTRCVEAILLALKDVGNLVGVFSSSESYVHAAAIAAQKLDLPHADPKAIANCRNKYEFAQLISKARLPAIPTRTSLEEDIQFPVIVKPNTGTGSIGVKLCHSPVEVRDHIQTLKTPFLIQEYIIGEEYSAEVLLKSGKIHTIFGMTKKHLGVEPHFVEQGHNFPATLSTKKRSNAIRVIETALQAIGLDFGPAHIEFRIRKNNVYIIEINPRLAGGMIPILIEKSLGIDLIGGLINLFTGQDTSFQRKSHFFTKISFIIPKKNGKISDIQGVEKLKSVEHVSEIKFYKKVGDDVTLKGDFTDRIGHVILKAPSIRQCKLASQKALSLITISTTPLKRLLAHSRLKSILKPDITQVLSKNYFKDFDELEFLSQIDRAHVSMLEKCGIISTDKAETIHQGILDLKAEGFESVHSLNIAGIGFYLAYEQALADKIGLEKAGLIHSGRSRNDINATIQRFKSIYIYKKLYISLWILRSNLLQAAQRHLQTSMPIYSQYQPAMPATYAYYLLAVEESLGDNQTDLKNSLKFMKKSTMGSASGAGTTYPIDPALTAQLLGFDAPPSNALTAVSTRDVELRLLSIGACIGTTITRIAQDFHLWLTQEFSFLSLPDSLCGISSAMPQKKNPFLLEKIKGKAINIAGELLKTLATIQKVPFGNSVEVGTEALTGYTESFSELIKSIDLLSLIVQDAQPNHNSMEDSHKKGLTIATEIAEKLANQSKISYREAHDLVGSKIKECLEAGRAPLQEIMSMLDQPKVDAREWHRNLEYGAGPGLQSTKNMLLKAVQKLTDDQIFFTQEVQNFRPTSENP